MKDGLFELQTVERERALEIAASTPYEALFEAQTVYPDVAFERGVPVASASSSLAELRRSGEAAGIVLFRLTRSVSRTAELVILCGDKRWLPDAVPLLIAFTRERIDARRIELVMPRSDDFEADALCTSGVELEAVFPGYYFLRGRYVDRLVYGWVDR